MDIQTLLVGAGISLVSSIVILAVTEFILNINVKEDNEIL
jgi:hypothetical protein